MAEKTHTRSKLTLYAIYATVAAVLLLGLGLAAGSLPAGAQQNQRLLCEQLGQGYNPATDSCVDTAERTLGELIESILNILSIVVAIAAVIMLIVGGIKYVISGGETAQVAGAKNTIIYALVGLVIVAFAQAIVIFVLSRV